MIRLIEIVIFTICAFFAKAQVDTMPMGPNVHVASAVTPEVAYTDKFMLVNGTQSFGNILMSSQCGCGFWVNPADIPLLHGATGPTGPSGIDGTNGVTGPTGANGTNGATGAGTVYYNRTSGAAPVTYTAINYTSKFTTNGSGVIVDTLTTNGLLTGTAIFSHIYSVQITGKYGGSAVTIPLQAYTVAANLKSITINVGSGTVLGLLGATVLSVGSGQEESILITGD